MPPRTTFTIERSVVMQHHHQRVRVRVRGVERKVGGGAETHFNHQQVGGVARHETAPLAALDSERLPFRTVMG